MALPIVNLVAEERCVRGSYIGTCIPSRDVPNYVFTLGYTNASWTLKADLTARWLCRLLRHMDRHGHAVAVAPRKTEHLVLELVLMAVALVQMGQLQELLVYLIQVAVAVAVVIHQTGLVVQAAVEL